MMKNRHARSLRTTLMSYFMATMITFCFIICLLAIYFVQLIVQKNNIAHYEETSKYVGTIITRELDAIADISNYMFLNSDVKSVIENYDKKNYAYIRSVDGLDNLLMQNVMSNVYSHLSAMVIFDETDIVYRYERDATIGRTFDLATINSSDILERTRYRNRMIFTTQSFFGGSGQMESSSICIVRSVTDRQYNEIIGGFLLEFDIELLDEKLTAFTEDAYFSSYLVDETGTLLRSFGGALPQEVIALLPPLVKGDGRLHRSEWDGYTVFICPMVNQRCYMVFLLAPQSVLSQSWGILSIILLALIFGIVTSLTLWRSLSRRVVHPIAQIRASIEQAREGVHLPIVTELDSNIDEVEMLVASYNQNVRYIDQLAEKLSEEKTRYKDLEYKALQSQINSHFITNTLNAVRWLAIMQKANNIKEIIDAFSRLLKSTWQGMENDTTIEKELSNARDYMFIQQVTHSYNCRIDYAVDESLMKEPCAKFILQPLVENAFFHGIASKGSGGVIRISIQLSEDGRDIVIQVIDNGVGMDESKQQAVLCSMGGSNRFNGIGISNIHQRLMLKYGEGYGVSIQSQVGCYTKLTVVIPRLKEEDLCTKSS